MNKIKLFKGSISIIDLQIQVDEWIKKTSCDIISTSIACDDNSHYILSVLYIESTKLNS